jgi:hypothetical protein
MPRLAADPRGNILLVWAVRASAGADFKLVYQRSTQGAWTATTAVPGGAISDATFKTSTAPPPLSMNANGFAALAWGDRDAGSEQLTTIHLANFY